jgi:hypothetical protein
MSQAPAAPTRGLKSARHQGGEVSVSMNNPPDPTDNVPHMWKHVFTIRCISSSVGEPGSRRRPNGGLVGLTKRSAWPTVTKGGPKPGKSTGRCRLSLVSNLREKNHPTLIVIMNMGCVACRQSSNQTRKAEKVTFSQFVSARGCDNELAFYLRAQQLQKSREMPKSELKIEAQAIFDEFVALGAEREICFVRSAPCQQHLTFVGGTFISIVMPNSSFAWSIFSCPHLSDEGLLFRPFARHFQQSNLVHNELKNRIKSKPTTSMYQNAMMEIGFILQPLLIEYIKATGARDTAQDSNGFSTGDSSIFFRRLSAFTTPDPSNRTMEAATR